MAQYYDMKLVTFGVDEDHSLLNSFQVFVKAFNRESLVLYKIETVPVPINDLNKTFDSNIADTIYKTLYGNQQWRLYSVIHS